MIRLIYYLLIVAIGLGAAIIWLGEMHHLRRAIPQHLPVWTLAIDGRSGVPKGHATMPVPNSGLARFEWRARLPDADGLLWDLQVNGDAAQIQAAMRIPFWPKEAAFQDGRGTISLDAITGGQESGLLRIAEISGYAPILNRSDGTAGRITVAFENPEILSEAAWNLLDRIGKRDGNSLVIDLPRY